MSRADMILQGMATGLLQPEEMPLAEDVEQWYALYHLAPASS
jgi:hypothetical protein